MVDRRSSSTPSTQHSLTIHSHTPQIKQQEKEIRLLILGLDHAGKTTCLRRLCDQPIDTIEPTLGFHIQSLLHGDYQLNLWDVGGQKSIRAYWRNYFEDSTDGLIWVVDSSDKMRLQLCRDELFLLLEQEQRLSSVLILANKQDVPGALSADKIRDVLELEKLHRHWKIQACSAKTGEGLAEGLDWIVDDVATRIYMLG